MQLADPVLQIFHPPGIVGLGAERRLLHPARHVLEDQGAIPVRQTKPLPADRLRSPGVGVARQQRFNLFRPRECQTVTAVEVEMNVFVKCFLSAKIGRIV